MLISGSGFPAFTVKIKPDYAISTKLALQWVQSASGEWFGTDRGASSDVYKTQVRLYGYEASGINKFISNIESNRTVTEITPIPPNIVYLSNFNSQEHIFGADVDYSSSIAATIFMDRRSQNTWLGFEITVDLTAIDPSFVGGSGSIPALQLCDIGYDGDADYTIKKNETYNNTFYYADSSSDSGKFIGTFTFTDNEMIALRRYLATQRAGLMPMPTISGVKYPFGRRTNPSAAYCKITEFDDLGMYSVVNGVPRWKATLTITEVPIT